jgi:hypothetical protein
MTEGSYQIPESLVEATSIGWLSNVLGSQVVKVTLGEVDDRVSTNVPICVEFADETTRHLWIKGYFTEAGHAFRLAGVPESMFYRELAADVGVRTLRPVFADADLVTHANILITEDELGEGAVFLDSLIPYGVDQVAESLEQLAQLHAATWMHPTCEAMTWLEPRSHLYTMTRGIADLETNFSGPIGAAVPEIARDAHRLFAAFSAVADELRTASPWAVIHGDPHIGNLYLNGAGRPSFLDWQLIQRGPWFIDVGYHLASSLTVEDRRLNEESLVHHYLDRLGVAGVSIAYSKEAWKGLCRGFVHGFYLWGITLKVDPRKTAVLLERLGSAVADHGAYAEVRC